MRFSIPAIVPATVHATVQAIVPAIVLIETVSYVFRVVSLALRIFANILSGHCMLKIVTIFV